MVTTQESCPGHLGACADLGNVWLPVGQILAVEVHPEGADSWRLIHPPQLGSKSFLTGGSGRNISVSTRDTERVHVFCVTPESRTKISGRPGWCGSVVEHRPMNQEVMVRFWVRAHAQVVGLIPGRGVKEAANQGVASPRLRGARPHPDLGPSITRAPGHVASSGPRGTWPLLDPGARPHPDPGPSLTRIQGHTVSPGPGTQPHPDPGAHGLTRTRDPASPGPRGAWPHPDPGVRGITRTWGRTTSPGPRGTASPGPRTQPHPDPGVHGLSWTQVRGLTRTRDPASPGPRGTASPGPGTQPHPGTGVRGLPRTQGHAASPGPGTQPHLDPGACGLTRIQGRVVSPGPGTQRGLVFLIPIPVGQFPLSNSFGHPLKAPGRPPWNSPGSGLGEAPVRPVHSGGPVQGRCSGTRACSGNQSPGEHTQIRDPAGPCLPDPNS
ncbi:hypothetical protein QTO34_000733 [Cnephaeus nilssonii]|uniref:Uncharacterized protein n=1 Tax=Cnephaeus nilssonii TaxID=3371016 RepID=A0AA40LWV5_CNENI|nr:hypothetical protein QTO34_000733 [Eptesicus nilssonii]